MPHNEDLKGFLIDLAKSEPVKEFLQLFVNAKQVYDEISPALKEAYSAIVDDYNKSMNGLPMEPPFVSAPEWLRSVKLIHSSELSTLDRFEKYQNSEGISYYDYVYEYRKIKLKMIEANKYFEMERRLKEIDTEELVRYESFSVEIPGSWVSKEVRSRLENPCKEGTVITCDLGEARIEGNVLVTKSGFLKKVARVHYSCPSLIANQGEINNLRYNIESLSDEDRNAYKALSSNVFSHPVLFVSHRWESVDHPDPSGKQLRRLAILENCFLIYDYFSFPQRPYSEDSNRELQDILRNMDRLVQNVVILNSEDYLERGWCIYEYLVSSLKATVICDEIGHDDFVGLRNASWSTLPLNLVVRDSYESIQQNGKSEKIIKQINKLARLYRAAKFTVEEDKAIVRRLLIDHLKKTMPNRKEAESPTWKTVDWDENFWSEAFEADLNESEVTGFFWTQDMNVPQTLDECVERKYRVGKRGWAVDFGGGLKIVPAQDSMSADQILTWMRATKERSGTVKKDQS